ncbi:MAG: endo-1,4-beta-xylanase, partial [Microthrixaceae bacterium]
MNVRAYFDLVKSQVAMISVLLLLLLPAFGCSGSGQASDEAVATTVSETTSAPITSPPNCDEAATCTTRQLADSAGVTLGAAVAASHLGETDYRTTLLANFNSVTPENELKWATIHPAPGTWNFGPADRIIKFAQENNLQVKGHNLIWDQKSVDSTPDWVLAIDDPIELRSVGT